MKLKYKKTYKSGGGAYTTYVNGKLVNIDKQYSANTWIAQSEDGEIDEERDTLVSLKNALERLRKKDEFANGGEVLLAPNGEISNLTAEQYRLVRTPAFKKWFGDWENDAENSSKVVDENGEPLVVYHGTYIKDKIKNIYTELNTSTYFTDQKLTAEKYPIGEYVYYNSMKDLEYDLGKGVVDYINDNFEIDNSKGIMYSSDAENVWENFEFENIHIYECFLDIKNPKIYFHFSENEYEFQDLTKNDPIINDFKNSGYDGLIKIYEARWFTKDWFQLNRGIKSDYLKERHFVIFNSNQIKLAKGNTTFDSNNPDIRFSKGGSIRKPKKRTISQTPAPKKDRIYGSKINKPKSSESKSKASSIILSPSVIKSIRTIINKHNEEYPNKKVPLSSAKAVVRRGMGAYSSTHRPTISGGKPNSRVAWGLARLNAFIYKIKKGKSKSGKYKQDDDLINELGYKVKPYSFGGQITDEQKETYKKWKELVNMSRSELEKFYNSEEGKIAGLSAKEAKEQGIDSGRESARWIMKMKYVPVSEWNKNMWRWAKKQISFISRMSGMKGKLYDEKGRKTRKHLALLIWGHNPEK